MQIQIDVKMLDIYHIWPFTGNNFSLRSYLVIFWVIINVPLMKQLKFLDLRTGFIMVKAHVHQMTFRKQNFGKSFPLNLCLTICNRARKYFVALRQNRI